MLPGSIRSGNRTVNLMPKSPHPKFKAKSIREWSQVQRTLTVPAGDPHSEIRDENKTT